MHARVVDLTVRSVDTKEMVRIYREEIAPAARAQEGFKGAVLLTDPQTCIEISVTLRKTEAEREAAVDGGFYDEKIERLAALLTGPRSASTTTSA